MKEYLHINQSTSIIVNTYDALSSLNTLKSEILERLDSDKINF